MKFKVKKLVVICLVLIPITLTGYIVLPSTLTNNAHIRNHSYQILDYPGNLSNDSINGTLVLLNVVRISTQDPYDVLLNSYMNSGSTFTGRLLGFHKDSFYFYEPLWHISLWSYYSGNSTMCNIKTAACRTLNRLEMNRNKPIRRRKLDPRIIHDIDMEKAQPIEVPQKILDHIYSCNISKVKNLIQPGVTTNAEFSGHSWDSFRKCEILKQPFEKCVYDLETVCKRARHRVSKVLRMTLGCLETVLRHNPRLKVIHLFRDPRAIINSRMETKGHPLKWSPRGSREIGSSAQALCNKMTADYEAGLRLMHTFPDRFRFVHYEDLVLNTGSVKKLYDFVGMTYDAESYRRVYAVKTNDPEKRNELKEKDRKINNALWWRSYLTFEVMRQIDLVCNTVYPKLGYPVFKNLTQLRRISSEVILNSLKFRL